MKIAFWGQPEYFRFCYEDDLNDLGEVKEFVCHFGMNPQELQDAVDFSADYNIFFRGEFIPPEVLNALSGIKIALSSEPFPRYVNGKLNFTRDSIKRYLDFRKRVRCLRYDYIFHYDEASLSLLTRDGLHLSGSFPFPVAVDTYCTRDVEKQRDIFFIGRSTRHREEYFGPLKHHYNFLHICHGVYGPPLIDYVAASKICLNIHAEPEISWEPRMQMLLACGAFVISEKITPNAYLRPGIDYVEVASPADAQAAVEYYLHNEEERITVATNGCRRVNDLLNGRLVFKELIEKISNSEIEKYRSTEPSRSWEFIGVCSNFWHGLRARIQK